MVGWGGVGRGGLQPLDVTETRGRGRTRLVLRTQGLLISSEQVVIVPLVVPIEGWQEDS